MVPSRIAHLFVVAAFLVGLECSHALFPRLCDEYFGSNTTGAISDAVDNASCSEDSPPENQHTGEDEVKQCSIFMAPSSLMGHTGFGIYTTRDIERGSDILSAPDGPSIPVVDYSSGPPSKKVRDDWMRFFDDYWWGDVSDQVTFEASEVLDYQVTFGSLVNHHCILASVDHRYPKTAYDDSLVDRYNDPGAGAFSYSMGREFFVNKDMKAGSELFLNYGHCTRDEQTLKEWKWTAFIPMTNDYKKAASVCWKHLHPRSNATDDVNITAPSGSNEFVAKLLPETTSQLHSIIATYNETINSQKDLMHLLAKHMTTTPRTTEWIRENGMCLDNLVPRKSTLPHAGQGAFAQYFVPKGAIVVPAPMLHIVNKDVLLIHEMNDDEDDDDADDDGDDESDDDIVESQPKWQLLLNYCFGHNESSLLLCPDTNAILINHCSQRMKQCGPHGPNAEYRWSSGWEPKSDEFRKMTLDELAKQPGRGLSMEIVALRDIQAGEEVFIDYGSEWEIAWEAHVTNWKPPAVKDSESFLSAKEANEQKGPLDLLVSGDIRNTSKHSYLFTGCQYRLDKLDTHKVWSENHEDWGELDDEELLSRFADDGSVYNREDDYDYWPCTVVSHAGTYVVRIHQSSFHPDQIWNDNYLPRLLTDYPRESIRYFVKPYANDQRLLGAFRHYIPIRNEMFPEQWKNIQDK